MDTVIDVIIPCRNAAPQLLETLDLLQRQQARIRTVTLMDTLNADGSSGITGPGGTVHISAGDLAVRYPFVRIVPVPAGQFDHGGTRDLGASLSKDAGFLLFMTQDAVPRGADLTARLLEGFTRGSGGSGAGDGRTAVVYARQIAAADSTECEKLSREFSYPEKSRRQTQADVPSLGVRAYFCSNVCAMYDAEIFRKLGGFIHRTIFNEDMIYAGRALQAGYAVYYEAEAGVEHSHRYSARQQFSRSFDLGVSQADHPEIFGGIRSESEGWKYVHRMTAMLRSRGASMEIPGFYAGCAARLCGYRLGRHYRRLPRTLILRWTMNGNYWRDTDKTVQ